MRPEAAAPERPTLIFDGECGFCRQSVNLVRRWDRGRRLDYVAFQDQARIARFGIPLPALAAAMHLALPDGRVFAGADAAPEILGLLPRKRWLAALFRGLYAIPGMRRAARRVYAWIAARRKCVVRGLGDPPPPPTGPRRSLGSAGGESHATPH